MHQNDWLTHLKAGDEVLTDDGAYISRVARVTKTLIVAKDRTGYLQTWRRVDGALIHPERIDRLQQVTQVWRDAEEASALMERLQHVAWWGVPLEKLRAIAQLLPLAADNE